MSSKCKRMRHLEKNGKFYSYSKRIGLKGTLLFWLLFSETKNCMHNKCMGLYGNLAKKISVHTINNSFL